MFLQLSVRVHQVLISHPVLVYQVLVHHSAVLLGWIHSMPTEARPKRLSSRTQPTISSQRLSSNPELSARARTQLKSPSSSSTAKTDSLSVRDDTSPECNHSSTTAEPQLRVSTCIPSHSSPRNTSLQAPATSPVSTRRPSSSRSQSTRSEAAAQHKCESMQSTTTCCE